MGYNYAAFNKKAGTFYELGRRGAWFSLGLDTELFQDDECLAHEILTQGMLDQETEDARARVTVLAEQLVAAMKDADPKDIEVLSDGTDESAMAMALGYRCVGTLYGALYASSEAEALESIETENEHLRANPFNERWLNPERYRHYRRFDDFDRGRHPAKG